MRRHLLFFRICVWQHHHLKLHWSLFSLVGRAKLGTNPALENIYAYHQGSWGAFWTM
uniref:Uncharacterized protein n=1 Tax=Arundo donax TaxID=35708 RepID=A0A0A9FCQ7_ARUDO